MLQAGAIGLEADPQQDHRTEHRGQGHQQQRVAQRHVVGEDEIGDQRHRRRAHAETEQGDHEQVDRRGLAAHRVGHDLLDRRRGHAERHAQEEHRRRHQRRRPIGVVQQRIDQGEGNHRPGGEQPDAHVRVAAPALRPVVGQAPAEDDAETAEHRDDAAVDHPDMTGVPAVGADEEGRHPGAAAVAGKGQAGETEIVAEHGLAVGPQVGADLAQRHRHACADSAPGRLADRQQQQAEEHAGGAEDEEDQLPRAHLAEQRQVHVALGRGELDHQPAEQEGQPRAQVDAHRVDADRRRPTLAREAVGDQRIGRWRQRRLADPDADPEGEELPIAARQAAGRGHRAPHQHAEQDQAAPAAVVGHASERDTAKGVEQGEGQAHQQAHFRIADGQVATDRADQQVEDLPVDEGQHIGDHEDRHRGPGRKVGGIAVIVVMHAELLDAAEAADAREGSTGRISRQHPGLYPGRGTIELLNAGSGFRRMTARSFAAACAQSLSSISRAGVGAGQD